MCKAVQYFFAGAELPDGFAVVFLVKEKSGFLTVFDIYDIFDTVFLDRDTGIKRLADKAFVAFHAFLKAYFGIASFINAADVDAILLQDLDKGSKKESLELFDSKGQRLDNKYILIFVNRESRKKVGFSEDDAAG